MIRNAYDLGLGEIDLDKVKIKELEVAEAANQSRLSG